MAELTDLQRALKQAWYEADKAVAHLTGTQPAFKYNMTAEERETYQTAILNWREAWYTALGFREGLEKACALAKVPNFEE